MTLDDLAAYGVNVEEGMGRCMGNEQLYLRLMDTMRADEGFDRLKEAVEAGRLDEGFEAAHALKGALGNLAVTPLYEPMCEITEMLRERTDADYAPLLGSIMDSLERFRSL